MITSISNLHIVNTRDVPILHITTDAYIRHMKLRRQNSDVKSNIHAHITADAHIIRVWEFFFGLRLAESTLVYA
jgi:hypothetical protein